MLVIDEVVKPRLIKKSLKEAIRIAMSPLPVNFLSKANNTKIMNFMP